MDQTKPKFLFICKTDDEFIRIGTQEEIDGEIKHCEDNNIDLFFKVIAKINQTGLTVDFPPSLITWYEEGEQPDPLIKKVVLAIINYILYYGK